MTIELLEQQISQLNYDARETARKLGKIALPTLLKRFQAESARERALVLRCLAEVKGDEAIQVLVRALQDSEPDVRNTALVLLHTTHSPIAIGPLTEMLNQSPHPLIRGEVARILGRMGAKSSLPAIKEQVQKESDAGAAHKMDLAIARMEDGPARIRVVDRLKNPTPAIRYQAIGDLEFVNDPKLITELLPLLKDEAQVVNVGLEQWPVWHRVCDRAVEAVVSLSGKALSFPTGKRTYSKDEIQQARERIKQSGR